MKRILVFAAVAAAAVAFLPRMSGPLLDRLIDRALAGGTSTPAAPAKPPASGPKVTFLELGSVGCKPCEAMKPVMEAVRKKYGGQVEVTFYDVRKEHAIAREYRVFLIPTQVFLDSDGRERFRHEGFFPLEKVEEVLRAMGVR